MIAHLASEGAGVDGGPARGAGGASVGAAARRHHRVSAQGEDANARPAVAAPVAAKPADGGNTAFQLGGPQQPNVQRTGGKKKRFVFLTDCTIL